MMLDHPVTIFLRAKKQLLFLAVVALLFFVTSQVTNAATYNLTSGQYPPCSSNWNVSGTTYTCAGGAGRVTLANGDILSANTTISIVAAEGFSLASSTLGSASANINLTSNSGTITATGTTNLFGSITGGSAAVTLANATVTGTITTAGNINLTGGSVAGLVTSSGNNITTNGTNMSGGARANSGMSITGGTLAGAFVMTANNSASFSGVTMTSGSISGSSTLSITNSTLGSSSSSIAVSANNGAITVQSSTVYGNLTAPNYATVNVTTSTIYGNCLPNSTPANACNANPSVCTTGFIGGMTGSYFNNRTLTGTPTGTRVDNTIDFDWSTGSPGVSGVGVDAFSVRWSGSLRAPVTGVYQFQTTSDDGMRLRINNQLVIDNWTDHPPTTNTSSNITLTAGQSYPVVLEYYESTGVAVMKLHWKQPQLGTFSAITTQTGVTPNTASYCEVTPQSCTSGLNGGIAGKYYNNTTLTGSPAATRIDESVNFSWGSGSPGVTGIGSNNFSVRWDGTLKVGASGGYQFQTVSDDGVRVWINNQLVIDNWPSHTQTTNTSSSIALTAGTNYPVRVEYYETTGVSVISLTWKKPSDSGFVTMNVCPSVVGYYAISHSGTGITCAAEPITITAYDTLNSVVIPTVGTQITLSTTPATGAWVGGNSYSFTGKETSALKYLQQTSATTLNIDVTDGVNTESASFDPPISFVTAALKFYGSTALGVMPNQVAGVTDTAPILKAIKTDTDTGACVAQVTGTKSINLGFVCVNPKTCIADQTLTLNGLDAKQNALGAPLTYNAVNLTFDATGTASIPLNYSDVGQVRLEAQLNVAASGNNPTFSLTGRSGDFVVRPHTLAVSAVQTTAGVPNQGGTNQIGNSPSGFPWGFVAAGTSFKVWVEAQNAAGGRTPNFGNENNSENNIKLVEQSLVYPLSGTLTPLTNANTFTATTPAGTFLSPLVVWEQVGSLKVRPELADNFYLGVSLTGPAINYKLSDTIGRFYPDRFALKAGASVSNTCINIPATWSFSYMGQPAIALNYTLQAESTTGTVLTNYGPGYGPALASVMYVAENLDGANGASLSSRVGDGLLNKSWLNGVMTVASTTAVINRQATTMPDGPYVGLQWGLDVIDTFDSRSLQNKNMNASTSSVCSGSACTAVKVGEPLNLRYGRLRLDDAAGSELANLPVNFSTEFWTGSFFDESDNDNCTKILRSAITYPGGNILTPANLTVALNGGSTTGVYGSTTTTEINFTNNSARHFFQRPTGNATGQFIVDVNLTSYPWLRFDWNQNTNHNDDLSLPPATFSFGTFRGNDRIIYWRERFQ